MLNSIKKKLGVVAIASSLAFLPITANAIPLDNAEADVRMTIGLFAKIQGLDDFFLLPSQGADGDDGTVYSGSDDYRLISNGQVRVSLEGANLSNGEQSLDTIYKLDDAGVEFDTAVNSTHNAIHNVSASVEIGDIDDQKAGEYSSTITLTVSAL